MSDAISPAEDLLTAVVVHLIRKGVLDGDDLTKISDDLSAQADAAGSVEERERLETAAHLANCLSIEAAAPSQSDWEAEQARSRFRLISNSDGGNDA